MSLYNRLKLIMVIDLKNNFSIGGRLRTLRLKSGLSQEQLALEADITPAYLCQLEKDTRNPTLALLGRVCDVLEISLSDFFLQEYEENDKEDRVDKQIMGQLRGKTEKEKTAILQLIKCALKLQNLK